MNNEYKQYICDLNLGDLKKKLVWLDAGMNSTKLMTGLRHHYTGQKSNVPFDDYDVLYMVIAKRRTVWGELVVVNLPFPKVSAFFDSFSFSDRTINFTDLKTSRKMIWASHCYSEPFEPILLSDGKTLKLWETPYILKASTEYDKDFRKEWQNGELVYEGNNWGDTSIFCIIGCLDIDAD